ncbi:MAG: aminopeptidase P family protein [Candidatus Levybacteria bacterium]|nr:aminopeptidase P family protein [Candidatus Levybacteria bacterium]
MNKKGLDVCLFSAPENIYYLTGLNHWGFFALHVLIVPLKGTISLVIRQMETVVVANQLGSRVEFRGYRDSMAPSIKVAEVLHELEINKSQIGMDMRTLYRSYTDTKEIVDQFPKTKWIDIQEVMNEFMFIKSDLEIAAVRQAASITEMMMEAAIRTTAAGVNENEVAAEVYKAMVLAGGEYPSFGPFIRPKTRLGEEHGAWGQSILKEDDTLFVELAGCYKRYHAPMGRFIYLKPPEGIKKVVSVTLEAFAAVTDTMKPGVTAHDVYSAWQKVVDKAGIPEYRRHHSGYKVGISFPPTWMTGGNRYSLREESEMELKAGMEFHVLSWLVGSKLGDYFVSDTVLVTPTGSEVLTKTSQNILTAK